MSRWAAKISSPRTLCRVLVCLISAKQPKPGQGSNLHSFSLVPVLGKMFGRYVCNGSSRSQLWLPCNFKEWRMHASSPMHVIRSTRHGLPAHLEERLSFLPVGKTESGRSEDEAHTSVSTVINMTIFPPVCHKWPTGQTRFRETCISLVWTGLLRMSILMWNHLINELHIICTFTSK